LKQRTPQHSAGEQAQVVEHGYVQQLSTCSTDQPCGPVQWVVPVMLACAALHEGAG
jgi:hypothetical protein